MLTDERLRRTFATVDERNVTVAASSRPSPMKRALAGSEPDIVETLIPVINRLGEALLPTMEIVLHDLRKLPTSIVAVAGQVTGRTIGDPPTDKLLSHMASGSGDDMLSYQTSLPGGRQLVSSTILLRDSDGTEIGALCVNNDVTPWLMVRGLSDAALQATVSIDGLGPLPKTALAQQLARTIAPQPEGERFARSVEELADHMITKAIAEVGVPVDLMKKEHKIRVVAALQDDGMFLIRDAIETVAASLDVSRFTIYNYINELAADGDSPPAATHSVKPIATGRPARTRKESK